MKLNICALDDASSRYATDFLLLYFYFSKAFSMPYVTFKKYFYNWTTFNKTVKKSITSINSEVEAVF
jgi:hypothetical protein